MTRLIKVLPIFFLLLLYSCEKETTTFQPTETSTQSNVTLSGIVTDESDEPIEGVVAIYKGISTMTNSAGIYEFRDVLVDSKHNTVQLSKEGYFETNRTFRTTRANQLIHETQLIEKNFDNSFSTDIGGRVNIDMVSIDFRPNTIVFDNSKEDYNGEVKVAVNYLDPADIDIEKKMPGDLSLLSTEDILQKATSYGMAFVELESPSGEKLQIKEGTVATLTISVSDELLSIAPEKVTASHFNELLGLWEDETTATLINGKYFGEVTHFSCWNYNSSSPSVVLTGRVVDELGVPVPGLHVQVSEVGDWTGGFGYTDEDGMFTGAVAKDALLKLYVRSTEFCAENLSSLISDDIGPFTMDINIGDLSVDLSEFESITVNASFFNCDGEPVTNGIALVARSYFKITDGTLNVTVPVCDENTNYIMWAHDLDTDKVTERIPLIVGQVNSYEDQTICAIEAPFLDIISEELNINFKSKIETVAISNGADKFITGFFENDSPNWNVIKLNITDPTTDEFREFAYVLQSATIKEIIGASNEVTTYTADFGDGEVVVEEVGNDGLGDYIKGYYKVNFTQVSTNDIYEFKGKFKLY